MSSVNSKVEAIREQLKHSSASLYQLIDGPIAALPLNKLYQAPTEDEWTIMEILAHLVELMPYWADEVAKLVAQPGQNFGRLSQQEERLAALRDHGHDGLEQVKAALPKSYRCLDQALSHLQGSDLTLTGHHMIFGERTLAWFIDELIVQHVHNHIVQMQESLQALQ